MAGGAPNNRVTTQTFFEAQLKTNQAISELKDSQNERMDDMERRIMAELKGVPTQVETNKEEIKILRKQSNVKDIAIAVGAAIGTAAAALIGSKQ
jgi:hypothetical protein